MTSVEKVGVLDLTASLVDDADAGGAVVACTDEEGVEAVAEVEGSGVGGTAGGVDDVRTAEEAGVGSDRCWPPAVSSSLEPCWMGAPGSVYDASRAPLSATSCKSLNCLCVASDHVIHLSLCSHRSCLSKEQVLHQSSAA